MDSDLLPDRPRWRAVGPDQDIVAASLIELDRVAERALPRGVYAVELVYPPDAPPLHVGELFVGPAGVRIEVAGRFR